MTRRWRGWTLAGLGAAITVVSAYARWQSAAAQAGLDVTYLWKLPAAAVGGVALGYGLVALLPVEFDRFAGTAVAAAVGLSLYAVPSVAFRLLFGRHAVPPAVVGVVLVAGAVGVAEVVRPAFGRPESGSDEG